ncbi:hypothetical protein GCM10007415_14040 [Parapedobacter pyrenivorans]|uniref:Uncharacterized protein n=1 Tax=Parapedobacter pyrenivorans TaxID=1305674 RepID=A0A917M8Q1_9SPHI|nr:hypothetical protein [Parapedobacter pyrenivorans]GGG82382.1 hypothetical protein GCM10007415_14040 [Parapedobacter pyrenivorans]
MKKLFAILLVIIGILLVGGCVRNDDEPVYPVRPIARLYVSIEDYQRDASKDDIDNVVLIDPADTLGMYVALNHDSDALGGAGIYFNPFVSRLFQAGYNDTTIRVIAVGNLGSLENSGSIGNRLLSQMRGIVYHHPTQMLYVASNATSSTTTTTIYGFYQPMNRNGFTKPDRTLRLGNAMRPWGMLLWGDSLLVSNSGANGGVSLYGNLSKIRDTSAVDLPALSTIRIAGATAIRGIAFVDSLDVLVAADYGAVGADGARVTDGKVYIIEGIKAHLKSASATVSPTRTISGAATGLVGPVDVAIDPRGEAGRRTVFVADRDGRKVSRFSFSASGNIAPEETVTLDTLDNARRPFGVALDVRGVATQ